MSRERTRISPVVLDTHYVIRLHDRIVNAFEEFMVEAGAIKGRDLRLEGARRRRSGGGPGVGCARKPIGTPPPPRGGPWKPRSWLRRGQLRGGTCVWRAPAGGAAAAALEGGTLASPSASPYLPVVGAGNPVAVSSLAR
jgi:hypothetical protein